MTQNRRVLFVGGGKVAASKIQRLTGHSWKLTVLSPEFHPRILNLARGGLIETHTAAYQPGMLNGYHLVFAATDDKELNGRILDDARRIGIPGCAVDGNWRDGDFITPAIAQCRHGIAAFSSGGSSHRVTRLLKGSLQRQLDAAEDWTPIVIGTSHQQISLERRETLRGDRGDYLEELRGVHEFMVLTTCNRIEFYGLTSARTPTLKLIRTLLGLGDLESGETYELRGLEALTHMARVGAGLLSQTPGENHIVSQLKTAIDEAERRRWAGPFMKDWFAKSLHVSKHIRARVSPLLKYDDLEDLAAAFIGQSCLKTASRKILLLGSGTVGRSMAAELERRSWSFTWAYHSRPPEAPRSVPVLPMSAESLEAHGPYDILISALRIPSPLLPQDFPGILKPKGRAVDLGVPRNLDSRWQENHSLTDMEDLKHWYRRNMADTQAIMNAAEQEITGHRSDYDKLISFL